MDTGRLKILSSEKIWTKKEWLENCWMSIWWYNKYNNPIYFKITLKIIFLQNYFNFYLQDVETNTLNFIIF